MIVCRELSKHYLEPEGKTVTALDKVSLNIRDGEFYVLLGPSGSGKTTTLRAIAGLEYPDAGLIEMAGETVFSSQSHDRVPPEQRPIAMVFQSYALWPHMDVYENIAFPLRRGLRRIPSQDVRPRVERVAALLGLEAYLRRSVAQLSGGQQQRVALARALALEPKVLLMDEPLSNLDARLRGRLRIELKELASSLGITTVYVTHDQVEAMVMGDRIAVMDSGRILQEGSPPELYRTPNSVEVARFLGDMNLINATAQSRPEGKHLVAMPTGQLEAAMAHSTRHDGPVTLGFRPEDAVLLTSPVANGLRATVTARHYLGESQLYQLDAGGASIQAKAPGWEVFEPGQSLFVQIDPTRCMLFDVH